MTIRHELCQLRVPQLENYYYYYFTIIAIITIITIIIFTNKLTSCIPMTSLAHFTSYTILSILEKTCAKCLLLYLVSDSILHFFFSLPEMLEVKQNSCVFNVINKTKQNKMIMKTILTIKVLKVFDCFLDEGRDIEKDKLFV